MVEHRVEWCVSLEKEELFAHVRILPPREEPTDWGELFGPLEETKIVILDSGVQTASDFPEGESEFIDFLGAYAATVQHDDAHSFANGAITLVAQNVLDGAVEGLGIQALLKSFGIKEQTES